MLLVFSTIIILIIILSKSQDFNQGRFCFVRLFHGGFGLIMVAWAVSWFGYPWVIPYGYPAFPVNLRADLAWAGWSGLAIFLRLVLLKEFRKEFKLVFRSDGILPKAEASVGANKASRMAETRRTRKETFIFQEFFCSCVNL